MNWKQIVAGVGAAILAIVALLVGIGANTSIRESLLVARTPISWIAAILPGPAAVQGIAIKSKETLEGPYTGKPCFYYRKHVEREEKDSDGNSKWVTVEDVHRSVPFLVEDKTAKLLLDTQQAQFRAPSVYSRREGNMRYTEYAIQPRNRVFVFGDFDGTQFRRTGEVQYVISGLGEGQLRFAHGVSSLTQCIISIACATFAIYLLCFTLRVHHIFVFLSLLTAIVPTWLLFQWFSLTSAELRFGGEVLAAAAKYIEQQPANVERTALLKQTYNDGAERFNDYRARLPNQLVSMLRGVNSYSPIPLSSAEAEIAADHPRKSRPSVHVGAVSGTLFGVFGTAGLIGMTIWGFRKLRVKRLVENLPTSPTGGVVVGLSELVGTPQQEDEWLTSRYAQRPCAWYRYETKERRGSGKHAKWVTIESGTESTPFWLADREGAIRVYPNGAKVTARQIHRERVGKRLKQEWVLDSENELYILGPSRLTRPDDDELSISKDDYEKTYLISIKSEEEIQLGFARIGFLLLNLALVCGTVAVVLILSMRGFSPFNFFLSGLFPPLYLAMLVVFFLYNDLVFLQKRAQRALSMIDVALKKRADLVPQLVKVAQQMMRHEREVQADLTQMRQKADANVDAMEDLFVAQTMGLAHFFGVVEAYPDLKSNELVLKLQQELSRIETEIGFARSSYNDAVERFNTRIQSIPEVFLARMFSFKPLSFFDAQVERKAAAPTITVGE